MQGILGLLLLAVSLPAFASQPLGGETEGDPHYCKPLKRCEYMEAYDFPSWNNLPGLERRLLAPYLKEQAGQDTDPAALYREWTAKADSEAASFLAITHAFRHMYLIYNRGEPESETVPAVTLFEKLNKAEGDRSRIRLDSELFERWRQDGAHFAIVRRTGEVESGRIKFRDGSTFGGSLHKGYDIQGFTTARKAPRIQINYRFSDSEADIDLDGYAPIIFKFLPNLRHLTYANSDVRQWYKNYEKKFGNAGFKVRKRVIDNRR